jgi:hypothetical protein
MVLGFDPGIQLAYVTFQNLRRVRGVSLLILHPDSIAESLKVCLGVFFRKL